VTETPADSEDVRFKAAQVLSDDWATLTKYTLDHRRHDGQWETIVRQAYDRGDGAAIAPFDPVRGTVLLVRQFRLPCYLNGHPEPLIEACAGLLDKDDPETCIRKEAEEELGYRFSQVTCVFKAFMSPGSVTERLFLFVTAYSAADRIGAGGGHRDEGEDIEVLEMTLDEAMARIAAGDIIDAKTIMLLQHLKLNGLSAP
jgi:nudix-type nucleoside diphosphatase (YffH/AdpP family)